MLAALDALIDSQKGGHIAVALKQAATLVLRAGFDDGSENWRDLDELMATLAMALDDDSILVLGEAMTGKYSTMTAFTATVMSRLHEVSSREVEPPPFALTADPPALASDMGTARNPMGPGSSAKRSPIAPANERRALPRDPNADMHNPLSLARAASPDKLEKIARLPALPEPLTSIIVSRGHIPATIAALENPGASFGRVTLATLAELSATDRTLRLAMAARADLPGDAMDRLWPLIGREARARAAMSGTLVSVEAARHALAEAEAYAVEATEKGKIWRSLDQLRRSAADSPHGRQGALIELADQGRAAEFAAFASAEIGVSYPVAFAMIGARLDHPSAILVCAIGGTERVLEAVLAMRRARALGRSFGNAMDCFDRLDVEEARLLVRVIDERAAPPAVAEPVVSGRPHLALVS